MGRFSGRLPAFFLLLALIGGNGIPSAQAYTPTVTRGGKPVRWKPSEGRSIRLPLAGNPRNQSGIHPSMFFDATVRGLQRWKAASGGTVDFDYWQGTDPSIYVPESSYDGLSSIYFASSGAAPSGLSGNVLGLTQVWYDTDSGEILETDIVLNDISYQFTNDPRHTSGYGSSLSSSGRQVFIENVITHELGHAFGFSHSGGLQSTMLFMESPEQAFLGCDEQVGVHAHYPRASGAARATLRGNVVAERDRRPIFGAHVLAISRRRGNVLATALTDSSGRYELRGLEAGDYFLMVEPFFAGSGALPEYYSGINTEVCGGSPFGRTPLTEVGTNRLRVINARGGTTTTAPTLVARCGSGSGAAVSAMSSSSDFDSAPVVHSGSRGGFGITDRFSYTSTMYYGLQNVSGRVEIRALAYSVYSPVRTTLSLLDEYGNEVYAQTVDAVYEGTSGFVNYDSAVIAPDLPAGNYIIQISASPMDASQYPAGPVSLDSVPFVMLSGSINEPLPPLRGELPFNARCRMDENFAAYSSPPGNPERRDTDSGGGIGFCGTLSSGSHGSGGSGSSGNGSGPGAGAVVGWFLPWAFMLALVRLMRQRELRLTPIPG